MIAAGTGILPFIDLLDLIFKVQISKSLSQQGQDASIVKPTQDYPSIFPGARFKLLCAFRTIDDFTGWDWIDKIALMSQQDGDNFFECTARVTGFENFQGITYFREYFNAEFYKTKITPQTNKIFVCGPPVMQAQIFGDLKSIGIHPEKIFYV